MRLLQLAGLIAALAGVYFAQYVFDHASLTGFLPESLLAAFPGLNRLNRWLSEDLYALAIWVMALSSLGFGLLAPMWKPGAGQRVARVTILSPAHTRRQSIVALVCAGIAAAIGFVLLIGGGGALPAEGILWLISLTLLLIATVIMDQMRSAHISYMQEGRPERGWPLAVLILAVSVGLVVWNGARLPAQIPEDTARLALQAVQLADSKLTLFAFGEAKQPAFASLPLAALMIVGFRPLAALRWAGLLAGMLLVAATWLAACELFRRRGDPPPANEYEHDGGVDDDGRTPALWALLALAGVVPLIHFGRLPGQLEATACGVLALWLLLRGARLGRLRLVAASGVLAGASLMLSAAGLVFVATAALLWLGLWLLRRSWLEFPRGGVGGAGALLWLGSLLLACSPLLGGWIREPSRLLAAQPDFFARLQPTVLAFSAGADASPFAGLSAPMLSNLVAPLFMLALGALLFRLDHLIGWTLILWVACTVIFAAVAAPAAPWWPFLLPALPAAALAIGFALDRIHAMIGHTLGGWTTQAASYLAVALLLLAGVTGWVDYTQASMAKHDVTTALARSLDAAPGDAPVFLLVGGEGEPTTWNDPLLRLAADGRSQAGVILDADDTAAWPTALPTGARVFGAPELRGALTALAQRYSGGSIQTVRDLRANPILYVYIAP